MPAIQIAKIDAAAIFCPVASGESSAKTSHDPKNTIAVVAWPLG